jgi:DNA-binding IclR family transcriptional regulator
VKRDRTAKLLTELADAPATITDLCDSVGLERDSCRAIVSQLRRAGVVSRVGTIAETRIGAHRITTRRLALYGVAS